jgi:prepilin peptidase CpaA
MTLTDMLDCLAIAFFTGFMLWAAVSDFRSYTIPNFIPLAVALLYPMHALAIPGGADWSGALITAAAVFAVGAVLFMLRLAGGGDVKLMAALALWAGPGMIVPSLLVTGLAGGALALAMLTWLRVLRPRRYAVIGDGVTRMPVAKTSMPYGVAIAAGGLFLGATLVAA